MSDVALGWILDGIIHIDHIRGRAEQIAHRLGNPDLAQIIQTVDLRD